MIQTDLLIIGAGPVGLFTVFEAGLLKMRCHLIDALPMAGGQLTEIYPKKPIYDIPGYPSVLAGDLIDKLLEQIAPFNPGFTLGERAESLEKQDDGSLQDVPHSAVQYVRLTLGMQVCTIAQLSDLLDYLALQSKPELLGHLVHVQAYRDRYGV